MRTTNAYNTITNYINKGDKILWTGKPEEGFSFSSEDIFLIPFSLFFLGFSIFWMWGASQGSTFFALFGIPFLLVGLYMAIGRFFFDSMRKKNTFYGITENQILIVSGVRNKKVDILNISDIKAFYFTENKNKVGTITLGGKNNMNYNISKAMPPFIGKTNNRGFGEIYPELEKIKSVNTVYTTLRNQQQKLREVINKTVS